VASSDVQSSQRPETNQRAGDDSWVDPIADDVSALLRVSGLQMELLAFYDPMTRNLHAVGYDGAPARYFRGLKNGGPGSVKQP
jgi:hypothetical protein